MIKVLQTCICGHASGKHVVWLSDLKSNTYSDELKNCTYHTYNEGNDYIPCGCLKFKLDNLKLVEDLARKKNLI